MRQTQIVVKLQVEGFHCWPDAPADVAFLRETPVRQALDFATPRDDIIQDVMAGRATAAFADQAPESWAFMWLL